MSDWTAFASGFATALTIVFTIELIKALLRLRRRRRLERVEQEWRKILSVYSSILDGDR